VHSLLSQTEKSEQVPSAHMNRKNLLVEKGLAISGLETVPRVFARTIVLTNKPGLPFRVIESAGTRIKEFPQLCDYRT
jgi:hypothetical protein